MFCIYYLLQYFSRTRELRTALVMWGSVELSIYDTSSTFMGGIHRMLRVRAHPFIALVCVSFIANDGANFSLIWSPFLLEVSTEITCPYFACWSSAFPVRFGTHMYYRHSVFVRGRIGRLSSLWCRLSLHSFGYFLCCDENFLIWCRLIVYSSFCALYFWKHLQKNSCLYQHLGVFHLHFLL